MSLVRLCACSGPLRGATRTAALLPKRTFKALPLKFPVGSFGTLKARIHTGRRGRSTAAPGSDQCGRNKG